MRSGARFKGNCQGPECFKSASCVPSVLASMVCDSTITSDVGDVVERK